MHVHVLFRERTFSRVSLSSHKSGRSNPDQVMQPSSDGVTGAPFALHNRSVAGLILRFYLFLSFDARPPAVEILFVMQGRAR